MPKMSTPPVDSTNPHEVIDWLRREGYEVVVQNMRSEPGRVQVEIVGYQTCSPRVEHRLMGNRYLTDEMLYPAGLPGGIQTRTRPQGTKPAESEPVEETFGLAQPWEDVAEWFNC